MSATVSEEQVVASLDRWDTAFAEGRSEYFAEFAEDAMIFTADAKAPIKGREAYRQSFENALTGNTREKTILDRRLQIVGDKAVVTQKARITQQDATANVIQTFVYGETGEGLKVLHSQTALLKTDTDTWGDPSVRVVHERIATVADVVGVAQ